MSPAENAVLPAGASIAEVADGVWVGIPAPGEGAMGAIVGERGGVVVDTTSYDRFARAFLASIEQQRPGVSWRYLVVSHRHFDHFGGADAIPAPMLCHRLTKARLAAFDEAWLSRNLATWIAQKQIDPDLIDRPVVPIPSLTFDDGVEIDLGDRTVIVRHTGGHTADESMVYVPEVSVLFCGDNLFNERASFTGHGDIVAWIEALGWSLSLGPKVVVPGHGPVGSPELLTAQIAELRRLLDEELGKA